MIRLHIKLHILLSTILYYNKKLILESRLFTIVSNRGNEMKGKVKDIAKKSLDKHKEDIINSSLYHTYYHEKIDENAIYVECDHGKDFTGNVFRIVEEISKGNYGDYKIYVYGNQITKNQILKLQKNYNLKIHKIITKESEALKTSEKAKYIIIDSTVHRKYVKRPEQILIYLWNNTPFKTIGRDNVKREHILAAEQQTILSSDYLLFANEYSCEKVLNAYMMEKIYPGKILIEGYPRNCAFFDDERSEDLKSKLKLKDKEIFAFISDKRIKGEEGGKLINDFAELDNNLKDNQILFIGLNPQDLLKINFKKYKHIKPFPTEYERYEVLNCVETLITDYTSALFDFANAKGKIILYNKPDDEFYLDLSDLPFPQVQSIEDLVKELNSPKEYDDSEFIEKYCKYDKTSTAENICKHIFKNEKICEEKKIENDKPNVLIFGGALFNNGITSSLINLLNNIDRENYNIFISYRQWDNYIKENHEHIYNIIPAGVEFLPLRSKFIKTMREKRAYSNFLYSEKVKKCPEIVNQMLERAFKKQYPGDIFQYVVNFDGYGEDENLMFSRTGKKASVWVHNDMIQEIETRDIQNINTLREIYNAYENVVVVSPDLIKPTSEISGRKDNIRIVHNINTHDKIQKKGENELYIDKNTEIITRHPDGIFGVLNSPGKKIITIGRYSPEKGHDRLLNAFDELCEDYPDTQLIIIGGHGKLYNQTINLRNDLRHWKNVTLIKWISNPMPILKQCDLFVLSSFYEGWPMVLMEADTFDVPVLVTDITGTQWMKDYGGHIVENSQAGILQGLYEFAEGNVDRLGIDYEEYNKNAVEEFYSILK